MGAEPRPPQLTRHRHRGRVRTRFSAVGMRDATVQIVPGTVRELTEDQFTVRTKEAVTILLQNYLAKVRDLRIRFY